MKFEEIYGRTRCRALRPAQAASVLGVSERRAPVDTVIEVLDLFDIRYFDFTARHFCEKLVSDHDFKQSYNWVRLTLQAYGRTRKAPRP